MSGCQAVSRCLQLWQKVPSPKAAARRGQASSQYPSPCPSPWKKAAGQIRLPEWPSTTISCSTAQRRSRTGYPCSPHHTAPLFPGALDRLSQGSCPSITLLGRGAFRTRHIVLHATVQNFCPTTHKDCACEPLHPPPTRTGIRCSVPTAVRTYSEGSVVGCR